MKPQPNEDQREFITRCMFDENMLAQYPNKDQRLAECAVIWRDAKTNHSPT